MNERMYMCLDFVWHCLDIFLPAPGYTSRSVAGSYDNEGIAIFALVVCEYFLSPYSNARSHLVIQFLAPLPV